MLELVLGKVTLEKSVLERAPLKGNDYYVMKKVRCLNYKDLPKIYRDNGVRCYVEGDYFKLFDGDKVEITLGPGWAIHKMGLEKVEEIMRLSGERLSWINAEMRMKKAEEKEKKRLEREEKERLERERVIRFKF